MARSFWKGVGGRPQGAVGKGSDGLDAKAAGCYVEFRGVRKRSLQIGVCFTCPMCDCPGRCLSEPYVPNLFIAPGSC